MRKLVDVDIEKVAGVDAAANQRKWLVIKAKDMKGGDKVVNENGLVRRMIEMMQRFMKGEDVKKELSDLEKEEEVKKMDDVLKSVFGEEVLKDMDEDTQKKLKSEFEKRDKDAKDLKDQLEKSAKSAKDLETKVEELEKKIDPEKNKDDDILKSLDPKIKKAVAKALEAKDETIEKLSKRLGSVEEERTKEKFFKMAAQYPNMGKAEDVSEMLRKAYEVSEEHGKKLEATFKASNERIAQSDLFKELGAGGDGANDAWGKIEELAKGLVAKDAKITHEQAIAKVMDDNPDLYAQYEREKAVN